MRAYYFWMKFWHSFATGFRCGLWAVLTLAVAGAVVYCLYFA